MQLQTATGQTWTGFDCCHATCANLFLLACSVWPCNGLISVNLHLFGLPFFPCLHTFCVVEPYGVRLDRGKPWLSTTRARAPRRQSERFCQEWPRLARAWPRTRPPPGASAGVPAGWSGHCQVPRSRSGATRRPPMGAAVRGGQGPQVHLCQFPFRHWGLGHGSAARPGFAPSQETLRERCDIGIGREPYPLTQTFEGLVGGRCAQISVVADAAYEMGPSGISRRRCIPKDRTTSIRDAIGMMLICLWGISGAWPGPWRRAQTEAFTSKGSEKAGDKGVMCV